jgi:hypothetical protein
MNIKSLLYFTTPKLVTLSDIRIGGLNKLLQSCILGAIIYDLCFNELYLKTEIPSGYTTFWTENGNLSKIQNNNISNYSYCNNKSYDYAYDADTWVYREIDCIKLPYSEMYIKGENEFFFLTHFTEYDTKVKTCQNNIKCIERDNKEFFTIGSEGMILAFDHFYATSFEEGSNLVTDKKGIETFIKDKEGNTLKHFDRGETIKLSLEEWLNFSGINLDYYNEGTPISYPHPLIEKPYLPFNRLSGVEIIIKVNYYNMKSISGYEKATCELQLMPNAGWASKGSTVTYIDYPNVTDINDEYKYIDRYKYGVKFKFIVSGIMGKLNVNNVISHLVSGLVLVNTSSLIVCTFVLYFLGSYGKKFKKMKYSDRQIEMDTNISSPVNEEDIDEIDNLVDRSEGFNDIIEDLTSLRSRKTTSV